MAIRKRKPTSPGRRFQTASDFAEITKSTPERSLTVPKPKTGGRNAHGRITSRFRGGGNKQRYRIVDFRRDKDGVPAKVAGIEYDPNRNARIALLHYLDGEKRYILAPSDLKVGDMVQSGQGADIKPGNALPLRYIPVGTVVHNVEMKPGAGGKIGRGAGAAIQLVAKEGKFATLHDWLRHNLYRHGGKFPPAEVIERATGHVDERAPLLVVGDADREPALAARYCLGGCSCTLSGGSSGGVSKVMLISAPNLRYMRNSISFFTRFLPLRIWTTARSGRKRWCSCGPARVRARARMLTEASQASSIGQLAAHL